jgi:autotransporter strand-loop-strand O-heptosyltransferase
MYKNIIKNKKIIREYKEVQITNNFNDGAYIEVNSSKEKRFLVEIKDSKGNVEFSSEIGSNMWCRTNKKYFEEYTCAVWDLDIEEKIYEKKYDAKGKKVYIMLDSKSVGDTMAWFPFAEEFRKKWDCKVICSTFWNSLFAAQYPEIDFVDPGTAIPDAYATYKIGLYFKDGGINYDMHRSNPTKVSLMRMASEILGLEDKEVRPKIEKPEVEKKKRVGIGFHSTAQTKYWNNPTGWQEVTDFLISKGYEVVMMSKEADGYMGNFYPKGVTKMRESSFQDLIENMLSCEFFIGISSGLSWLSWALEIPTVLISGFTGDSMEPSEGVVRISNKSVCNDCWARHKFDAGDWNWCPDHKGTPRQFECSKMITGQMVIDRMITEGLIPEEDLDLKEEERLLKFFEKNYEIVTGYNGDWTVSEEDIILKKKK